MTVTINPDRGAPLDILLCPFGTRGDVTPFVRIAQTLQSHGHRVRITPAPSLESILLDYDLETYPIPYDNEAFLKFGLLSGVKKGLALVNGTFSTLKGWQKENFQAQWAASIDRGNKDTDKRPFVADALIMTMPNMIHGSLAQRLSVPLFFVQPNPRYPTRAWPHTTLNPQSTIFETCDKNIESWTEEEKKVWKRYYRSLVNSIRKEDLGLRPLSSKHWPNPFWALDIPAPCIVSSSVLEKPEDVRESCAMVGYIFPELPKSFKPPPGLEDFLSTNKKIIYVDFASNVHDDKVALTALVLDAVKNSGVRAVIRKAWYAGESPPTGVFVTNDIPHSWLFPRVSLVVHAAGAGTTAMALKCGIPSAPVPIRGDQFMWSKRLEQLEAAPKAVFMRDLTSEKLARLIEEGLDPKYAAGAARIAKLLAPEPDGSLKLVELWHDYMLRIGGYPVPCSLLPGRNAVWKVRDKPAVRLSVLAAHVLDAEGKLGYDQLDLIKVTDWDKHACMKPSAVPRDPATDEVRLSRIKQGAFDFAEAEKAAKAYVGKNSAPAQSDEEGNGVSADNDRRSVVQQVLSGWDA